VPSPTPTTGRPAPAPMTKAFSSDPDRNICRKCGKEHYNFHWYAHCFQRHMTESR
jgi:hypothetical protein